MKDMKLSAKELNALLIWETEFDQQKDLNYLEFLSSHEDIRPSIESLVDRGFLTTLGFEHYNESLDEESIDITMKGHLILNKYNQLSLREQIEACHVGLEY